VSERCHECGNDDVANEMFVETAEGLLCPTCQCARPVDDDGFVHALTCDMGVDCSCMFGDPHDGASRPN